MIVKLSIHKDNMFTFFSVDEICNSEDNISFTQQLSELYRIFKLFEESGYKPQIIVKGE